MRCVLMIGKKQVQWSEPSKNSDLERLMREFGCSNDYVADYPVDLNARRSIGELISSAMQGRDRSYTAGMKIK
jgi:hypothetical protein